MSQNYLKLKYVIGLQHKIEVNLKKINKIGRAVCEISAFEIWILTRWRFSSTKQFFTL